MSQQVLMRAKLQVRSVEAPYDGGREVRMSPVCGNKPFGPNGESEDNTFARYTPGGELRLLINNPDLIDKIKPGQTFYVDFTEVPAEADTSAA